MSFKKMSADQRYEYIRAIAGKDHVLFHMLGNLAMKLLVCPSKLKPDESKTLQRYGIGA